MNQEQENILVEKRDEIIWSLFAQQSYSIRNISFMFNLPKSTVHNIISAMPDDWQSPWKKQ